MASAPDRSAAYLAHVDGLRGLAILLVVCFHAFPAILPGGFIGVDVFFVISGYVITRMLLPRIAAGELRFWQFLARRVRRLLPAMVLVTAVFLLLGVFVLFDDELEQLGGHAVASTFYSLNFLLLSQVDYFDTGIYTKPLLHLWSLAVEEQFYLVWPLFLLAAAGRGRRPGAAVALLALASFVLNAHLVRFDASAAFYLPFTRFWELAAGGWLASVHLADRQPSQVPAKLLLGASLLAAALACIDSQTQFPGWWALLPTAATLLLLDAGVAAGPGRRVLQQPLLVWIGLISYPLYLWHWPLLSFASVIEGERVGPVLAALLLACSFLLAWITVVAVERHVRHRRDRASLAVLLGASLAVGLAGMAIVRYEGFPRRHAAAPAFEGEVGHDEFHSFATARFAECKPAALRQSAPGWRSYSRCLQSKSGATAEVALVGDSHAEHLFPGLALAADTRNVTYFIRYTGAPFDESGRYDEILDYLLGEPGVRLVIVAAFWRERLSRTAPGYVERLEASLSRLRAAGKRVVVLGDVPEFSFDPRRCKYTRLGLESRCTEDSRRALAQARNERRQLAPALSAEIEFITLVGSFCDAATCRMTDGNRLLYRDSNHLSLHGSRQVGRLLVRHPALQDLLGNADAAAPPGTAGALPASLAR
jgi:peptidoglycan/LPS O-acetylase OafA/YrhL